MARNAKQIRNLKKLIDRADLLARTATREWRKTIVEIRKEIAYMTNEVRNIGGNADAREAILRKVQYHINRLNRRLDRMIEAQLLSAGKVAHADAEDETGIRVEYDKAHAKEILKAVTARSGANIAATFTTAMSRNAITALRNAVLGAFQEQAVNGGTLRDLSNNIRDRWEAAAGDERNFRFIDRSGREWNTDRYIQMNVRTNTMEIYNAQKVDTLVRATGQDLVRISDDGRTAKVSCDACQKWAGRIVSVTGNDPDFPSLDEAKSDGMFHPNCIHTLQAVIEGWDDDEIERQRTANREARK